MNTSKMDSTSRVRVCPKCRKANDEIELKDAEYRCPQCGFELAYLDVTANGLVRGVFGWLHAPGEIIQDRYEIKTVLGKGGFGTTYLVEDLRLSGKRRALKEIPEPLFDEYEVDLLSRLHHPAIPDIIDRFVADGMVHLVLEFGGNRTLGSECRRLGGRVSLTALLPWLRQLCEALVYLHSQTPAIVHRDLKPDNILLDDNDRVMLIDFGIAKLSKPDTTTRLLARSASHGFSPPEQVLGTGTDERSDIYALGATIYYLLTGQVPPAAHERVAGAVLKAPSELVPGLPPTLDEILLSALNLNLNQRPQAVQELHRALEALDDSTVLNTRDTSKTTKLDPGTTDSRTYPPGTPPHGIKIPTGEVTSSKTGGAKPPRQRKTAWAMPAAGLVLMGALGASGYFYWQQSQKSVTTATVAEHESATPASFADKQPASASQVAGQKPAKETSTSSQPPVSETAKAAPPAPVPSTLDEMPSKSMPYTVLKKPMLDDLQSAPATVDVQPAPDAPQAASPAPQAPTVATPILPPIEPASKPGFQPTISTSPTTEPQVSVAPPPPGSIMDLFERERLKNKPEEPPPIEPVKQAAPAPSPPKTQTATRTEKKQTVTQRSTPRSKPPEEKKPETPQFSFKPFQTIKTD